MAANHELKIQDNDWRRVLAPLARPDGHRSAVQLATTLVPYGLVWTIAIVAARYEVWAVLPLVVVAASLLLARMYALFHELSHAALFRSRRVNERIGEVLGFLLFTSYHGWRHDHALHHANSGDLDHRGPGDITTLSVAEYAARGPLGRAAYRCYRNPALMLLAGPVIAFLVARRVPRPGATARVRRSVYVTNVAMAAWVVMLGTFMGWPAFLAVQCGVLLLGGMIGVWMLFVQHNFEDSWYRTHDQWNHVEAAVRGSSFLDMPRWLRWVTAEAGYHHVHHLSARIPNYYLAEAHARVPLLQEATRLTIADGIRAMRMRLWDEQGERMIGWREWRELAGAADASRAVPVA